MAQHLHKSIADIAALLRAGKVSAQALAEEAIDRHSRYGEQLGAYKIWDPGKARTLARMADAAFKAGHTLAPLHGIPSSVKDLFGLQDYPIYAGTPKRLPSSWEAEGPVVQALKRQLATITGKSHTVEFAFGGIGSNKSWGTPRNPWGGKQHRVPGGSSSGAGVSLGEGSALVALGSDTGGSVRIPASVTGNVGLKLTINRWSCEGIVPLSPSFDTPGVLARTVADTAYAFAALDPAGLDADAFLAEIESTQLAGLTFGICESFMWEDLGPGIGEGAKRALDEAVRKGARLKAIKVPEFADMYALHLKGSVLSAEFLQFLDDELPEWKDGMDAIVRTRVEAGGGIAATEYIRRHRSIARGNRSVSAKLAEVDALVMPTVPITPPTVEQIATLDGYIQHNRQMFRLTCPVNNLALCALTIPVARDKAGMPVGLQIVMRAGSEERLLAVGSALERALGTAEKRLGKPPLNAIPKARAK